jgi:hypothetical protein
MWDVAEADIEVVVMATINASNQVWAITWAYSGMTFSQKAAIPGADRLVVVHLIAGAAMVTPFSQITTGP